MRTMNPNFKPGLDTSGLSGEAEMEGRVGGFIGSSRKWLRKIWIEMCIKTN